MTALTATRDTVRAGQEGNLGTFEVLLGANKVVYGGGIVFADGTTGYGEAATTATSKRVMGVARKDAGAASGQSAGDVSVEVSRGLYWFTNDPLDLAAQADVGTTVFATDDATVSKTNGSSSKSAAGTLLKIGTTGEGHSGEVLVEITGPALP